MALSPGLILSNADSLALDALGSPVRRRILQRLAARPATVGELARHFPVSRPAVSKHLKLLKQAGLVSHQQEGTRHRYCLDRRGFAAAEAWLQQFWTEALENFRLVAESTYGDTGDE